MYNQRGGCAALHLQPQEVFASTIEMQQHTDAPAAPRPRAKDCRVCDCPFGGADAATAAAPAATSAGTPADAGVPHPTITFTASTDSTAATPAVAHEDAAPVGLTMAIGDDTPALERDDSATKLRRVPTTGELVTEGSESRVLVIYTGGTIGMMRNDHNVLAPVPNAFVKALKNNPVLHDEAYAKKKFTNQMMKESVLVLPDTQVNNRVVYSVVEYNPLLDSSNMSSEDWIHIGNDIRKHYEDYHGFVILHGTDTLSYTAAALSFMLENLGKTVIITGSQIPIFEVRGDGRDNMLGAVILAGNYVIPEVCIFFNNRLFRGNRTTKISSECFNAFDSLNFPPLANFGINIEVNYRRFFRQTKIEKFCVYSKLNTNVGLLRLFPSITVSTVNAFLQPPTEGVVLQSYGAGNVPSDREDILDAIRAATARGVIIVNTTQCMRGSVCDLYETGQALMTVGVTPGFDMTPEAALTKLSYVLAKDEWDLSTKRKMMMKNLRGELTPALSSNCVQEWELVDAVARYLQITTQKEQAELGSILYPAIVNSAIMLGSVSRLNSLKESGVDLSAANSDLRTPLHVACCQGNLKIVELLLLSGANVHMKDRFGHTPLLDAIFFDQHEVIKMLVKCGAHIVGHSYTIGDGLCSAAGKGMLKRLKSYQLAGADLNQTDMSNRSPLHVAVLHNQEETVRFLLDAKVNINVKDLFGDTPLYMAEKLGHVTLKKLLENAAS